MRKGRDHLLVECHVGTGPYLVPLFGVVGVLATKRPRRRRRLPNQQQPSHRSRLRSAAHDEPPCDRVRQRSAVHVLELPADRHPVGDPRGS